MKKSLIALAVLAASGAAMAQSSVTLYGRLDASIASKSTETTGAAPVAKLTQTGVNESNLNSTFWGLKGSEDLGGGLKAIFKLESRFAMDTGVGSAGLFDREASVGFAGGFGSVLLGRVGTAYDDLYGAVNNVFNSNFSTTGDVNKTGITSYTGGVSNAIKYISPDFSGFSGSALVSFGENKEVATPLVPATDNGFGSATNIVSLHIKYAKGPLVVGYARQEEKQVQPLAATAQDTNKYDLLGASYDFGVAKVTGAYSKVSNNTTNDKESQIGVSAPFGAFAVAAGYSRSVSEKAGRVDLIGKGFSLVGTYDLSKRTTLYAGYENTKVDGPATATTATISTVDTRNFAAGVRHTF